MVNLEKIRYEFNRENLEELFLDIENGGVLLPNKFKINIYNENKMEKIKKDVENGLYIIDAIIISENGYNWLVGGIDTIMNLYLLWRNISVLTKTKTIKILSKRFLDNFEVNDNIYTKKINFKSQVNIHRYFSSDISHVLDWLEDRDLKLVRGIRTFELKLEGNRREKWLEFKI